MVRQGGGEVSLGRLLAFAKFGKWRMKTEVAKAFAGAETEVEELRHTLELDAEGGLVARGKRDGLRESGAGLDEDEFSTDFFRGIGDAAEREVGGELREVVGVGGAQVFLGRGHGIEGGLDLAEDGGGVAGGGQKLVDAAGEGERPAAVENAAGDRHLESRGGRGGGGGGAEFLMPARAETGAPETLRAGRVAGITRTDRERGELADAQRSGALIEVEVHGACGAEGSPRNTRNTRKKGRTDLFYRRKRR